MSGIITISDIYQISDIISNIRCGYIKNLISYQISDIISNIRYNINIGYHINIRYISNIEYYINIRYGYIRIWYHIKYLLPYQISDIISNIRYNINIGDHTRYINIGYHINIRYISNIGYHIKYQIPYQISDIISNIGYQTTYLLIESNFAEGCVCLTLGYSQFTGTMSGSTKNIFIHHVPQPTICNSKFHKKKLYPRLMNHIYF